MRVSIAALSLSATFLTAVISNFDPYHPNLCVSDERDTTVENNHKLPSAYTFAIAVVVLVGVRLKRIKLHAEDPEVSSETVVGVFGGGLKRENLVHNFISAFNEAQDFNRAVEVLFHVAALLAGFVFLGLNKGTFSKTKCDGRFNSFALVFAIIAYYLSFIVEFLDGMYTSIREADTSAPVAVPTWRNTQAAVYTLGLGGIATVSLLRLSRAHDTTEHVMCLHDTSVITLTLVATLLGFSSMVAIRKQADRSKMEQFAANSFGWGFCMITLALLLMSWSYKDEVKTYPETTIGSNATLITVPSAALTDTLCAYINATGKWQKDTTSDNYLTAQVTLVCLFGAGGFILSLIMHMFSSKKNADAAATTLAGAGVEQPGASNSGTEKALFSPGDGLARNRLTSDGKTPYTSVSTLQFV